MWNVMEYSIGFFGGIGMAYGVYSSKWAIDDEKPRKWANRVALFSVIIFMPLIVYRESLTFGHFFGRLGDINNLEFVTTLSTSVVAIVLVLMSLFLIWKLKGGNYLKKDISLFFFIYLAVYIFVSYAITGLFAGNMAVNHHLYVLNIVLIFILVRKDKPAMFENTSVEIHTKKWFTFLIAILICIAILSFIAINTHGELSGSHNRFPVN